MSKVVFMFPGQGAQYIGMGKDFYDACEESKAVYELASKVTGLDIAKLCFEENEALNQTEYTQIAMYTTECAILNVLQEKGIPYEAAAGLSVRGRGLRFQDGVSKAYRCKAHNRSSRVSKAAGGMLSPLCGIGFTCAGSRSAAGCDAS